MKATIRWCLMVGVLAVTRPAHAQLSVQVAPDNGTHPDPKIRLANSTGNTVVFTVTNNGTIDAQFIRTCTGTGNVTTVSCTTLGVIAAGDAKTVTATFSVAGAGSGSVQLSVTSTNPTGASGVGKWDETIVAASATASPTSTIQVGPNLSGLKQGFTVSNQARGAGVYGVALSCSPPGAITGCTLAAPTLSLDSAGVAGASAPDTVTYASGPAGSNGFISVTPSFAGVNFTAATVTINVPNAAVTPDGQAIGTLTGQTGLVATFSLQNSGTLATIYALSLPTCTVVTNCRFANGLTTTTVQVNAGATVPVPVSYDTPNLGTGNIVLRAAFGGVTLDDGSVTVTTVPPVSVAASAPQPYVVVANATGRTQSFVVTNLGATASS